MHRLMINYCSRSDLMLVPGIGPKRADFIVSCRQTRGPFRTLDDLPDASILPRDVLQRLESFADFTYYGEYYQGSRFVQSDARHLDEIDDDSIDLIVTSPPYWQLRDYGHEEQIGQEETVEEYIQTLVGALENWKRVMRPHASIFVNIGDTYRDGFLVGIPALFEIAVRDHGWFVVNHIRWTKSNGTPDPNSSRLVNRHEAVYHLALNKDFYFDLFALSEHLGQSSNPGDVWPIPHTPSRRAHLAPFPPELARRAILLASPKHICVNCNLPYTRVLEPSIQLDPTRQQARRAMELFHQHGLTEEHFAAIRAVGISDAGKGKLVQTGAGGNAEHTKALAEEAKDALGGYFREFTFAPKRHVDWDTCDCGVTTRPSTVLDPFVGSGTVCEVAANLGRNCIGVDLLLP